MGPAKWPLAIKDNRFESKAKPKGARFGEENQVFPGNRPIQLAKHGIDRAIGDGGNRAGTSPTAILDALKNPSNISGEVDKLDRPFETFTGRNARVVINPQTGQIISVNPLNKGGVR